MFVVVFVHRGCERLFVAGVLVAATRGTTVNNLVVLAILSILLVKVRVVVVATVTAAVSATVSTTVKKRAVKCHNLV